MISKRYLDEEASKKRVYNRRPALLIEIMLELIV